MVDVDEDAFVVEQLLQNVEAVGRGERFRECHSGVLRRSVSYGKLQRLQDGFRF